MILFLLTFLPRLLVTVTQKYYLWDYINLSTNLFSSGTFTKQVGGPLETFRTPGYPVLIRPFLHHLFLGACLQSLLGCLTVYLVWAWIARRRGKRVATLCALFLALDWESIALCPQAQPETVMTLLLAFFFVMFTTVRRTPLNALWLGLLWGLAAFLKPIMLYIPVCLVWWWL